MPITIWTLTTDGDNMGIETSAFTCEADALNAACEVLRMSKKTMPADLDAMTADAISNLWSETYDGACIIEPHEIAADLAELVPAVAMFTDYQDDPERPAEAMTGVRISFGELRAVKSLLAKIGAPSVAPSPAALEVLRAIRSDNPEFETGAMVDHADVTARLGRRWRDICRVLDSSPVAPRLHVAVILEGGLCQTVVSDNPALIGLAYDVIDYDTEGADETGEVMQDSGDFADACISGGIIEEASIRVVTEDDYENAAIAAGWQHGGDNGGFWYDGNRFESWKAAASADEDCPTYATAREACDAEEIHPFPEMVAGQDNRACAEGWGLFENSDTGKLEIQADSESDIFVRDGVSFDAEAEAFVKAKAAEGSAYHIAVLARVGQQG